MLTNTNRNVDLTSDRLPVRKQKEAANYYTNFIVFCLQADFDPKSAKEIMKKLWILDAEGNPVVSEKWSKDLIWIHQDNRPGMPGRPEFSIEILLSNEMMDHLYEILRKENCPSFL